VEVFREVIIKNQIKHKVTVVPLAGKQGAKHKGKEGLLGKKELPKEDKLASKKGAPVLDKNQIQESQKQAMNLLNKLGLKAQKQKSNILGPGGIGSGLNEALGGLRGSQAGTAGGNNGLGTRGETEGGGGKALGIGAIGAGLSRGSGIGGVGFGRSDKAQTRIEPGTILYEGSLSKEEIQRVVEQFMAQIKYCYEKEFQKDPSLEGKLLANWIIAAEGNVNVSKMIQNTMNNQKVENCVLRVINRMVFPKPRGGGIVKVNYPFLFSSAGA